MYHAAAFTGSIAQDTLLQINALDDQILTIANSQFLLERDYGLQFAAALGTDLQRCRLDQPHMRRIARPYVRPIIGDSSVPSDPNIADYTEHPFRLKAKEHFTIQAEQDSAGAQQVTMVFGISDGLRPMPSGPHYWLRGTGTSTMTANAWTSATITWENDLEGGKYAVVGGVLVSATGIFFRLIHQSTVWRPGGLCVGDENERTHTLFNPGGLGTWLEFESDVMPNVEVLCGAADTAQTIYLALVQIRTT